MINKKKEVREFVKYWENRGYEKGESQPFWLSLLRDVLGVDHPEQFISFEDQVKLDHTSFIDGYIDSTQVMIEQKGRNKDLNKAIRQSDGSYLTSFQQAKRYIAELPKSKHPRWVVTCNFREFHVYDMERPQGEYEVIELKNLEKEYYRLEFLVKEGNEHLKKEMEVSLKAGEIVGEIYDAFSKQYLDISNEKSAKSLNMLCVRLVFCLYAEDARIFGKKGMFHDYLNKYRIASNRYLLNEMRKALIDLFKILDTPIDKRDPYLDDDLLAFPYVNGGLFEDEQIEIPRFTDEICSLLLAKASDDFDWSEISPTIFGAVFESTLNPETRRSGGMHYTSLENIHKVIDPLFLDDLKEELDEIKKLKQLKTIEKRVNDFQKKLSSLKFLDPAAGSGNFLTETYISLRKLENEAILLKQKLGQQELGFIEEHLNPIKVSIQQFYGIEINDFAVSVAKTALWIAESQMMKETEEIIHMDLDFLPLKTNAYIHDGNALLVDWNEFLPHTECSYIMGNPPFVGSKYSTVSQKQDMDFVFSIDKQIKYRKLDYVTCWYWIACEYIKNTNIECAFVSTNSIVQGEQPEIIWEPLFKKGIYINFAYRSFVWDSEASDKAHVHCVIVGFSMINKNKKYIYDDNKQMSVKKINAYLMDAPNVILCSRNKPLCLNVPKIVKGSQPTDGGNLILNEEERKILINKYPILTDYIRRYVGAVDILNNKIRYCLWLKEFELHKLKNMPEITKRLEKVRESRLSSNKLATKKWADRPFLFTEDRQPNSDYIILPVVSSENRRYIPLCYESKNTIANTNAQMIPNGNMYVFGVLMSNVHNAWIRVVAGRMKSDYAYSGSIVYNNFPWCEPTSEQKAKIEKTAQAILDARLLYPNCTLADMYGEHMYLYPELLKAHQENDKAVMTAYGFTKKAEDGRTVWLSEKETVVELFKMYSELKKE